jgi:hypothetical protein
LETVYHGEYLDIRWTELHNLSLHGLYFLPSIITVITLERMRWAGNVAHVREKRNAYRFLVGESEGSTSLESHMCKCEDNTEMGAKK